MSTYIVYNEHPELGRLCIGITSNVDEALRLKSIAENNDIFPTGSETRIKIRRDHK